MSPWPQVNLLEGRWQGHQRAGEDKAGKGAAHRFFPPEAAPWEPSAGRCGEGSALSASYSSASSRGALGDASGRVVTRGNSHARHPSLRLKLRGEGGGGGAEMLKRTRPGLSWAREAALWDLPLRLCAHPNRKPARAHVSLWGSDRTLQRLGWGQALGQARERCRGAGWSGGLCPDLGFPPSRESPFHAVKRGHGPRRTSGVTGTSD